MRVKFQDTPYGRLAAVLKEKGWMTRVEYMVDVYEFWYAHAAHRYAWTYWDRYYNGVLYNAELAWGKDSEEYQRFKNEIPDINAGIRMMRSEIEHGTFRF